MKSTTDSELRLWTERRATFFATGTDQSVVLTHRLKNTERLWLCLWVLEKTLASQTGQKLHLAEDPIISSCGTWHQRPYAMPQDEALVAFVDLRRIMERHAATFNTQILRALTSGTPEGGSHSRKTETGHSEQLMLLVDLYRANVHVDFKRWEESWLTGSTDMVNPKSPLQCTGILHLQFASLVILSLPLRSTSDRPTEDFDALRRDCYSAALGFISAYVDRSERGLLPCITNAIAVSAGEYFVGSRLSLKKHNLTLLLAQRRAQSTVPSLLSSSVPSVLTLHPS